MSRVKAVVGKSIMVELEDLVPNDIIAISDNENDLIISEIQINKKGHFKLIYKKQGRESVSETVWMDPKSSKGVFIHDLKNERFGFQVSYPIK